MTSRLYAVKYRRVSSKKQEKGYSLPAQNKLLDSYAVENGYKIVADFCEPETAKKAGRKYFNEMLNYLRQHPEVRIILAEKTDRVYRNLKDYVTLDEFNGLEVHLVKEHEIISDKSSSHQKFIHGIKVLMAKNYIDNLSEEVVKGQNEKAAEGIYPSKAPVGYKNIVDNNKKHIIVIDEERAHFVKKAFELYATGDYSALKINNLLFKEGFRTKKGHKYSKSTIERMFKNIFYTGRFEYRGIICDNAQHERLIDDNTFNIIQERLGTLIRTRSHSVEFPYSNMIKCGVCGGYLTAELKKGKYIYYHCNDYYKKGCKKNSYINEMKIDKIIADLLSRFKYTEEFVQDVLVAIRDIHEKKCEYNQDTTESINKQIQTIQKRIERAYIDKVDGNITEEFWKAQNRKWHAEKEDLYERLKNINDVDNKFYDDAETLLNLCKDSHNAFIKGTPEQKRLIAKCVLSNLTYKDKKLDIEPFEVFYNLLGIDAKNPTIEPSETQTESIKKAPLDANFKNGGNDEARTRDLMRDRHAL